MRVFKDALGYVLGIGIGGLITMAGYSFLNEWLDERDKRAYQKEKLEGERKLRVSSTYGK